MTQVPVRVIIKKLCDSNYQKAVMSEYSENNAPERDPTKSLCFIYE